MNATTRRATCRVPHVRRRLTRRRDTGRTGIAALTAVVLLAAAAVWWSGRADTSAPASDGSPAETADPVRAQSAIARVTGTAYDVIIDGESYRPRLEPRLPKDASDGG